MDKALQLKIARIGSAARAAHRLQQVRKTNQPGALRKLRTIFGGRSALERAARTPGIAAHQAQTARRVAEQLGLAEQARQYRASQLGRMSVGRRKQELQGYGLPFIERARSIERANARAPHHQVLQENLQNLRRFRTNARLGLGAGAGGAAVGWAATPSEQS